jgi:hypothetical protein
MKKVAICLKGAVSKIGGSKERFYYKNDLYREGDYIDYLSVANSIIKHIVTPNKNYDFDFFLHSWNLDLKNNLLEVYNPKKFLFEDNSLYNDIISSIINNPKDFGGVSGGLSLKKSIELKDMYEIEIGIKYDIVIIYRYDVLLWTDMILDDYNINESIYVNGWDGSKSADFHFVMSSENSNKFKYLYDSIYLYKNYHRFHSWIKNYIINIIKCNLKEDYIIAGKNQEHVRVINNDHQLSKILSNYK